MDQLRLFKLKHDLLKISVDLQTALAADTHLAEGQWLKEQLNLVKLQLTIIIIILLTLIKIIIEEREK
jgi:hypothetical protein